MQELDEQAQHAAACYIIAALYIRYRNTADPLREDSNNMYVNYMRRTKLLAQWLLPETLREASREGYSGTVDSRWYSSVSSDVCSSCFYYFGETEGGRLRYGCHHCRNCRDAIGGYDVQQLTGILRIGYNELEALFAAIIKQLHAHTSDT